MRRQRCTCTHSATLTLGQCADTLAHTTRTTAHASKHTKHVRTGHHRHRLGPGSREAHSALRLGQIYTSKKAHQIPNACAPQLRPGKGIKSPEKAPRTCEEKVTHIHNGGARTSHGNQETKGRKCHRRLCALGEKEARYRSLGLGKGSTATHWGQTTWAPGKESPSAPPYLLSISLSLSAEAPRSPSACQRGPLNAGRGGGRHVAV
jgi:hypothetical protein